ncbi:MAG: penicillin acylase family protein [Bacteroidales bacterium]|nr:penicillin acylase family protein [Bacteroidales bacterium]
MKTIKIIIYSILSLLVILIIAGFFIVRSISNGAKPLYNGELDLPMLENEVEIIFDERGMPHIYARSEVDLSCAVGYIMAQERLWQMDLIRRATTGKLSEILGEDYVQTDLFLRSLRMTEKSKMVLENTDKEILDCLKSFANGVNYYIEKAGKKLPPEFRILGYQPDYWTPEHTANIIGYMGWDLASDNLSGDVFIYKLVKEFGKDTVINMVPYYDFTGDPVYPDYEFSDDYLEAVADFVKAIDKVKDLGITPFCGSNNWAVSGDRSETGKPLFSNDMHLGLSSPGIWIQMHQVVPGKLNVTGVAIPGEPFIVAGHNEKVAWGMTNLAVDDLDLYLEKTNEEKTKYMVDGEWKDIKTVKETIKIKNEDDRELEIKYTHHGPIISGFRDIEDADLSMRWSGNDMSNELEAVYLLNRAGSWEDFNEALSFFNSISQNFIYADINGNIGLQSGGGIPVREGYGAFIQPGDSSKYDWKGYVPHEQLPYSYNPVSGSVSSANNKTVYPEKYPYYIGTYFYMPYRINRIREMLAEKEIFDIDDFKRMITDRHSDYARQLCELLLPVLQQTDDMSDLEREVYNNLSVWDYNMSADLFIPTFIEYYRNILADLLLEDDMEELYENFEDSVRDYYLMKIISGQHVLFIDDVNTDVKENLEDILLNAYNKTIEKLKDEYSVDTSKWIWGDIHKFTAIHPVGNVGIMDFLFGFNEGPYRVGGSNHTVSAYSYGPDFVINHGASQRHVYNTADWDESYTVIPTGTSGVPSSEFYCSQTETYCNDGFYKDHFSDDAVRDAAKYILTLKPKK